MNKFYSFILIALMAGQIVPTASAGGLSSDFSNLVGKAKFLSPGSYFATGFLGSLTAPSDVYCNNCYKKPSSSSCTSCKEINRWVAGPLTTTFISRGTASCAKCSGNRRASFERCAPCKEINRNKAVKPSGWVSGAFNAANRIQALGYIGLKLLPKAWQQGWGNGGVTTFVRGIGRLAGLGIAASLAASITRYAVGFPSSYKRMSTKQPAVSNKEKQATIAGKATRNKSSLPTVKSTSRNYELAGRIRVVRKK